MSCKEEKPGIKKADEDNEVTSENFAEKLLESAKEAAAYVRGEIKLKETFVELKD